MGILLRGNAVLTEIACLAISLGTTIEEFGKVLGSQLLPDALGAVKEVGVGKTPRCKALL
jgi:hypothetical protein